MKTELRNSIRSFSSEPIADRLSFAFKSMTQSVLSRTGSGTTSQRALVVWLLSQRGTHLSRVTAGTAYGVSSLTSTISQLRKLGLPIIAEWKTDAFGRRYKSYRRGPGFVKTYRALIRKGEL